MPRNLERTALGWDYRTGAVSVYLIIVLMS